MKEELKLDSELPRMKNDEKHKSLVFDTKTGELIINNRGTRSDNTNIVVDQIYEDGFFLN